MNFQWKEAFYNFYLLVRAEPECSLPWHSELGPQAEDPAQGSTHRFPIHPWDVGQSEFTLQPTKHMLFKQTCPRKQSLSNLQVSIHCPFWHLSFGAQFVSDKHFSIQIPSTQFICSGQLWSEMQVLGTRTHSTSPFPVKDGGHVHRFKCCTVWHLAFKPQGFLSAQGALHWPLTQTSLDLQLMSAKHRAEMMKQEMIRIRQRKNCNDYITLEGTFYFYWISQTLTF